MAISGKYGRVTLERGSVADDEPVFVIRACDVVACNALEAYQKLAAGAGSPLTFLSAVSHRIDEFRKYSADKKIPD